MQAVVAVVRRQREHVRTIDGDEACRREELEERQANAAHDDRPTDEPTHERRAREAPSSAQFSHHQKPPATLLMSKPQDLQACGL